MINNWQVPRNKRKLYPVVDILSLFTLQNLGETWNHDLVRQLDFESELERFGLKRSGERRDRRAGGARTYESWLYALGLIYEETNSKVIRTTLAGEALLAGEPPVPILANQLLKLQYPSPYSIRAGVNIHPRFQVRPFRFVLQLLQDSRLRTQNGRPELTKEEIGLFCLTEGENETRHCLNHVVNRILDYRANGDYVIPLDFGELYPSRTTGIRTRKKTVEALVDTANVFINFLEYSQLIERDTPDSPIYIPVHKTEEVQGRLNDNTRLRTIDSNNLYGIENFQRNYGLSPNTVRDNRNFGGQVITDQIYRSRRVQSELLHFASIRPIPTISSDIIDEISQITGYTPEQVAEGLQNFRPNTFTLFESNYMNMSSSGTEFDTEFEIATIEIFNQLGFTSNHTGFLPLNPDGVVISPEDYSGIIDTKAYRKYSITNDHRNRMSVNYIPTYQASHSNLSFFLYIAHGFISNIGDQIRRIAIDTGVNGAAITAEAMVQLYRINQINSISHQDLFRIFSSNSLITVDDINRYPFRGQRPGEEANVKRIFKIGELFCGAGGLALGAKLAEAVSNDGEKLKVEHEWANDYDEDSCESFRLNICPDRAESVIWSDVRDLDVTYLHKIDAFAFGFPCNDFSNAGKANGDEGNFEPLYTYGIKVLKHHQPKFFIAENVCGLERANGGRTFIEILKAMEDAGYNITPHLYKFEEYGLPQARHRIIIVGIRKDLGWKFQVPKAPFKNQPEKWTTAKEAIENPPIPENAFNHQFNILSEKVINMLSIIRPGDNAWAEYIPEELRLNVKGAKMSNIYRRLDPNLPAYTVTGSGGGGTHMYHYKEPRALTNRERARLQTFPDWYEFVGKKESVRRQIGMAVPVEGARIIVEAILKSFAEISYETEPSNLEHRLVEMVEPIKLNSRHK
ncbi:AlwI family type II restriction endonuclease [Neobacillus ginsengisoli]|uniref:Cytosine-specific methyltransferase n=1 Tax=Neobacillus ginsengisoli TaxID=904295 RepID=A0ABT9XNZ9_9BACI|nr:AlwI family type II restriction endonuclease [Neobacillus ginsengisoli]MDQ0197086.1 DNA-cytosine methyltransferase [Neobacillus ginsengisoli]